MTDQRPVARATPASTYRVQLHAGFGFDDAAAIVPYLARLGISHVYCSPVLQAAPGSTHGYDVVDPTRVSADLGGREGLERLAATAHEHGLGVVVDVVPNHMAMPEPEHLNAPLWETLRRGRDAPTATWFDVDWEHGEGRFGLPVLGDPLAEELAAGALVVDADGGPDGPAGEPVLRYYDHVFPLAPGSYDGVPGHDDAEALAALLERQHYRLTSWRDKDDALTHRRFFDVDTLVAVRVERPEVFDATHALLVELHAAGVVDGFRIDHPDGLADPQGYLEGLREATGGAWVVVEKILEGDEQLPRGWACAGTTGYDALRFVQQALVPPTADALDALWTATEDSPGVTGDLHLVERAAKREVLDRLLQPELRRLTRVAVRAAADVGETVEPDRVSSALTELLVQVDVYRAYVRPGHPVAASAADRLGAACERAYARRGDLTRELVLLERLLLASGTTSEAGQDLIVRFQQTCGPVMAKGVEDTTFYRWHELVALDEVGGDPRALADPRVGPLHAWAAHQARHHPEAMVTLSTHDTKRSEDVRARLLAAAGDPDRWAAAWEPVRAEADRLGVDRPTAYLVLQTLIGTWPISHDRLGDYLVKATRETKRQTAWVDGDEAYERRVVALAEHVADDPSLHAGVLALLEAGSEAVRATTLAATLLALTLPGVPDTYQGTESLSLALVDPDNRRPVDHAHLAERLAALDDGAEPADLGEEKLLVTARALRLRRSRPDLLGPTAGYAPLRGTGPHVVGFVRGAGAITLATRWPAGLADQGTEPPPLLLPPGRWRDELSGRTLAGGLVAHRDVLGERPVALLVAETGTSTSSNDDQEVPS